MSAMASQITSLAIVNSTVYSGTDPRKHRSSVSLAFVRGVQRWPVKSPHNGPVTQKMLPFDDVIMMYFVAGGRLAIMAHRSRPVLPPLCIFWEKFLSYTCLTQALILYSLTAGRLTARSREVSKPRDSDLDFQSFWNLTGTSPASLPRCLLKY